MLTLCYEMFVLNEEEIEIGCCKQILYSMCKKDFWQSQLKIEHIMFNTHAM